MMSSKKAPFIFCYMLPPCGMSEINRRYQHEPHGGSVDHGQDDVTLKKYPIPFIKHFLYTRQTVMQTIQILAVISIY